MRNLVDSHCHLNFDDFDDDLEDVIAKANNKGVKSFIVPGVTAESWPNQIKLQRDIHSSHIAFGLHPYFIHQHKTTDLDLLEQMLQKYKSVAVGECGLDATCGDMDLQMFYFKKQIELSNKYQKPLIVHHRQSHHLIFQCFKQITPKFGGVIHAFSGSLQDATKYTEMGFLLGVGGVITYERAKTTRSVIKQIPLQCLVLETDSPDMPLSGKQGERNEPSNVSEVAECLARLKGIERENVAKVTTENSRRLFQF